MTVLIGMILILLFLGCFVDQVSMMLITLPFFMPLVAKLNIDPVWFGIMFLICMQLGLLTPPFGLLLFTMKGVAPPGITMNQIYSRRCPMWCSAAGRCCSIDPVLRRSRPGCRVARPDDARTAKAAICISTICCRI